LAWNLLRRATTATTAKNGFVKSIVSGATLAICEDKLRRESGLGDRFFVLLEVGGVAGWPQKEIAESSLDAIVVWSWLVGRWARWMRILQTPPWWSGDPNRKSFGN
jgi:hypothetical protein